MIYWFIFCFIGGVVLGRQRKIKQLIREETDRFNMFRMNKLMKEGGGYIGPLLPSQEKKLFKEYEEMKTRRSS